VVRPEVSAFESSHALLDGVSSLKGDVSASVIASSDWNVLGKIESNVLLAERNYGRGKVVLWGAPRSFRDDQATSNAYESHINQGDNRTFFRNLIQYFADGSDSEPQNLRPAANAGQDLSAVDEDGDGYADITLDGSASSDSDGSIVDFSWTWSGGEANGSTVIVRLPVGATSITLTVTDDDGATDSDVVRVQVTPANWMSSATDLGGGWRWLPWLKAFNPVGDGWLYHAHHGWLYTDAETLENMFFYDVQLDRWFWSNATVYPFLYLFGTDAGWVYFFEDTGPGARVFARAPSGEIITEAELSSGSTGD
jgi:hypothetical protein